MIKKIILKIFFIAILNIYSVYLFSQNITIKGRVIAEDLNYLPYVYIMIQDTINVGKTNNKVFFQITIPISETKLKFDFVGMDPAIIELTNNTNTIEVIMLFSCSYDFISLKRAERKRKRRFKKIPALHNLAYKKRIFKTKKACYKLKFFSYIE